MAKILQNYPSVALVTEDIDGKLDFGRIFGRTAGVHIEIGSGKATFLLNQAKNCPQTDFLGIEYANKYYRYAVDRIGRWSLTNVRLVRTEAAGFLADFVPDSSVECFHIYFPDPWPKKRHNKRRFISAANIEILLRCLKQGGTIRIATDHADYFEQIQAVLDARKDVTEQVDFLPTAGADTGEWVGTNFERKYLKENRPIYTIAVRKKIKEQK
jgi:tRNA (guanine-N7-)-methyltransferase